MLLQLQHGIFRTRVYLIPEAYSKCWQISKMMRHIENPGISEQFIQAFSGILGTFSNIQPLSGILSDIKAYSDVIEPYSDIFRTLCNPCIYNRPIFRTLSHVEPEVSSKVCRTCKMIRLIQSPGIVRIVYSSIFKDIQEYLRDTDAYSTTFIVAQLGGTGRGLRCLFLEIEKSALVVSIFGLHFPFKIQL